MTGIPTGYGLLTVYNVHVIHIRLGWAVKRQLHTEPLATTLAREISVIAVTLPSLLTIQQC